MTVSVADEGIGITAQEMSKVFQRFYQVPGKSGARSGGIGMGLFICKSYVKAMGGKIWVESEEGKGSIFSFTIPAAESSPQRVLRRGSVRDVAKQRR